MAVKILVGDCLEQLRTMPDESVHCVVTSPPYYGLRDYGTARWQGGDEACDHLQEVGGLGRSTLGEASGGHAVSDEAARRSQERQRKPYRDSCGKCGATRVDRQIGLEQTVEVYVDTLVRVFREVRRVLRADGTLWLNLGDSYSTRPPGNRDTAARSSTLTNADRQLRVSTTARGESGLKPKDLIGIPWRVAFALQADGWYLRQDLIWNKPNPMPESVRDRCTKAHEYVFLLSKSERYYFDADAISEPASSADEARWDNGLNGHGGGVSHAGQGSSTRKFAAGRSGNLARKTGAERGCPEDSTSNVCGSVPWEGIRRNRRSVWTVSTKPFPEAHFATFPPDLIEPCVLAGCPPAGKRCDCDEVIATPTGQGGADDPSLEVGRAGMARPRQPDEGTRPITRREQRAYAWQMRRSPHLEAIKEWCGKPFEHYVRTDRAGARPLPQDLLEAFLARGWLKPPAPCSCPVEPAGVVLDPFGGSGTTALVAERLQRHSVLCELSGQYVDMAVRRIRAEAPLLTSIEVQA